MSDGKQNENAIFQSIFGGCCVVSKEPHETRTIIQTPNGTSKAKEERLNQQVGIGVVVSVVGDDLVIDEIAPGGPAAKSGELQLGDILVRVDGREVRGGKPDAELLGLILGPPGSRVNIGVRRRDHPNVIQVQVVRGRIQK
uniref:PDZ domain-containing protein n=1 Tax=Hemiselmis andersenii TaxID=464988 RepID=A0A6U2B675_HEMAN|mmetsp:Transcript_15077/g.34767  ORF Transcript_15077/g.34767 Transcript_15077/m.34767 type:complete len:141 (+) Transcript_15077:92-514(+)